MKNHAFINLFFAVLLCEILLLVVSLPGFAGVADTSAPLTTSTGTPTTDIVKQQMDATITSTPTSTPVITDISIITNTQITTPTLPLSPTATVSPTPTPTSSPSPIVTLLELSNQISFLPVIYQAKITPTPTPTHTPTATPTSSPPESVLFCDDLSNPLFIPDNNGSGVSDDISINDNRVLVSVRLYLDISHTWVGDLVVRLSNQATGKSLTVLDRPGPTPDYCSNNDIVTILGDAAAQNVDDQCALYPHAISGIYLPTQSFSIFSGDDVAGTWRLNVSDHFVNDTGTLNHWCLEAKVADSMPAPTPSPTPINPPSSAFIGGMTGQDQQLNLDCESRSAVDWAKHYGYNIDEFQFLNHLSSSNDPEIGFVGNPDGPWGNIPPDDYGVHAPPIASVLRDYGMDAESYRSLRWNDLRASIASGNPVIVWIIGGSYFNLVNGTPHYYIPAGTGHLTIVAPWEHTVIVVGYTPTDVTILNGAHFVTVPLDQFLDSWSVLDFMAVLAQP